MGFIEISLILLVVITLIFIFLAAFVFFKNDSAPTPTPTENDSFELNVEVIDLTYEFLISSMGTLVSLDIDWGDGTTETYTEENSPLILTHTYSSSGNYVIKGTNVKNYVNLSNYFSAPVVNKIKSVKINNMKILKVLTIYDSLLTNLTITGLKQLVEMNIQQNTLTQESIDNILITFNNFNTTYEIGTDGGTIDLSNQNPPSPPSASGLAAKAELESRNWTVIVDP